ncbi:MAG: glycogen synthase [Anaerolineae bacterium]|nr:glycogen synthase [Anaerolineae bacterium]MDW8172801.1 glycogen synthase [Anaerolineae bacterium]
MNVLIVSAEAFPFAKVGGLADVIGSLPAALIAQGVDARVLMPGYGLIPHSKYAIHHQFSYNFDHRQGRSEVHVYMCIYQGVTFYFLQGWPYFGQESSVYTEFSWDMPRFIWFNQAAMAFLWELRARLNWMPDVVNVNDWHTGLLPFMIAYERWKSDWKHLATVTTIHNIAYSGNYAGGFLFQAGIPGRDDWRARRYGLTDNMLGISVSYSDMISTVSPRYAQEIQHPYAGYELAELIRERRDDLRGILNGLDVKLWNPSTDPKLFQNFDADNCAELRIENKRQLQRSMGLRQDDNVLLVGMVSRLAWQKGFDLAVPALRRALSEFEIQVVILGTGEYAIERDVESLARQFPDKARAYLTFDGAVAQQIYGGCDLFLMPSHFEPCGMGQMIAMRYGALPLVRETGGLADTVQNYDDGQADEGTGFVFQQEEARAVYNTLRWALATYHQRPQAWQRMQDRAMRQDFSWERSAREYMALYRRASDKRPR